MTSLERFTLEQGCAFTSYTIGTTSAVESPSLRATTEHGGHVVDGGSDELMSTHVLVWLDTGLKSSTSASATAPRSSSLRHESVIGAAAIY